MNMGCIIQTTYYSYHSDVDRKISKPQTAEVSIYREKRLR
jgi:hypothetical protein